MAQHGPEVLEQVRTAVIRLSALQEEFRAAVQEDFSRFGKTVTEYCRMVGASRSSIRPFLDGGSVMVSGRDFDNLISRISRQDLKEKINAVAPKLNARVTGLAVFSEPVITCVFILAVAYDRVRKNMTTKRFATFFGQHHAIVEGSLIFDRKQIEKLTSTPTRQAIEEVVRQGITPDAKRSGTARRQPPTHRQAERQPQAESTSVTVSELLERHGGATSPTGTPFILTSEAFRPVEGDPGEAFVHYLRRQIQITRGLLNLAAQLRDDRVRETIRVYLNDEITELYSSIQMFTFSHPNNLTQIFDAQRKVLGPTNPRKRG